MAMPRPSGKVFEIAKDVIPGMPDYLKPKSKRKTSSRNKMSKVENMQTNNIENGRLK